MPIPIDATLRPWAILRVLVSPGGANQVTELTFSGATAGQVITLVAETAMQILQNVNQPPEGQVRVDDLAFTVPIGGYARFPVAAWEGATPRILLASATPGAVVRVMVALPVGGR